MQITLREHGLQKFIEEDKGFTSRFISGEAESSSPIPNLAYEVLVCQDNLITAWFLSSMSKSQVFELFHYTTSREVWLYLCNCFSSKNVSRVMDLKGKLDMMKKGNMGLQEFLYQDQEYCSFS